jgi:predicted restriction endonuclease
VKIHEDKDFLYKILHLKPTSKDYAKVNTLIDSADTRSHSHALLGMDQLTFLDSLRKINIGKKVIPAEIIEEAFKEPINHVPVEEEKYDTTTVLRSRSFRDLVLYFYDFKCAITGKDLFIDHKDFNNLEAAHLLARAAGGGGNPSNGMALERNLHWAFDKGFFTVTFDGKDYHVEVHKDAMRVPYLASKHKMKILVPEDSRSRPNAESLKWHKENVFGLFLKTEI